ncbi:DUF4331 family protein [Hymenobacter nivis]|uniref:Secretion system C-terminal sorting domain-containing protein n=1 Tax=Hymenobacter nivis TaxID=1850093 RepID=A0A2Z3GHE9_9BACT|nr:DUF4331 family protein [Hymenobacter nivis]AWM31631.1 hypothetical protein DDQ68_01790 [Hymenobacter nivis]
MNSKFIPKLLLLPAVAAAAAVGLSVWSTAHTPLEASSHREAPLIADDPVADNTDLYAFKDPNDASKIVVIANYIPFELPQGGPNYSTFGENVRYEVHVKNKSTTNGDDITYRFTFKRVNEDPSTFFNIRLAKQNLKTTYTCEKSVGGGAFTTIVTNGVVAPNNIGPRSINDKTVGLNQPSYTDLRQSTVTMATSGEQVFCGPSDDPFFADLGAIFDLANLRPSGAADGLSHKNCHSIALSIPVATLQKDGKDVTAAKTILDPDYVIGVWASASRPAIQTFSASAGIGIQGDYVQVSRIGMPLTNEVINPIGGKDRWNALTPYNEDAGTDDYLSNPELGLYVDTRLFGNAVPQLAALDVQKASLAGFPGLPAKGFDFGNTQSGLYPLKGSAAVAGTALADASLGGYLLKPNSPRSVDIKPIFHTGVPNMRPYQLATGKPNGNPLAEGKPFINNFLPLSANISGNPGGDMLRLNMAVPATPRTINGQPNKEFSNQGLLAAAVLGLVDTRFNGSTDIQPIPNMDGFPNGRRLEDEVVSIELKAVGGAVLAAIGLWYDDYTPNSTSVKTPQLLGVLGFKTGVENNDTTFRATFPFVQTPWIGTGAAGGPTNVVVNPNLIVSTAMPVEAGTYNNITITGTGVAAFNGPIQVNGTLTLQTGGTLSIQGVLATSCLPVTGPGSFVMQDGSTLRICSSDGISAMGSTGAIQLTRTFNKKANYVYNGGAAQTTGTGLPDTVRSLTVNNTAGLTLNNGGVRIAQVLALTNGNLITSASQPLTLLSTPKAGTALVVNTNGAVVGPATMQRAIDPFYNAGPGYRHYSSPVASATLNDLSANTPGFSPIFNQAYNSAGANSGSVTPFPNVFGYDQARVTSAADATSAFDMGFVVPMGSDPMSIMSGYTVNIPATAVVALKGTLNNGPQASTNLMRGTLPQSGWQLLGNPYPSPLDFSLMGGVTRTNVDDAVYVYQSTGQYVGQYRSYVNGVGNPQISAMQGFFARVSTGQTTGSLALNNAARVTTFAATPSFNRGGPDTRPLVNLKLQGAALLLADEANVYFEQGATAGYDAKFDAYKLPSSSGLSISSFAASDALSINGLAPLVATVATSVPLDVQVPNTGVFTLNAASVINFAATTQVLLLDAQTGARIDLKQQPLYTFTAATKSLRGRFSLYFGPSAVLATNPAALAQLVQLYPNPARGSFTLLLPAELGRSPVTATLYNQLGQVVSQRTLPMTAAGATAQFDVSHLAFGIYTLQMTGGTTKVVKRLAIIQ